MATLVLNRDSLSVKLESNHLIIHDHAAGDSFQRVPLVDVERVIVVGQPAITFPVFAKLLDLAIPCSFLTHGGWWRGLMDGDPGFHAGRRKRQYDHVFDGDFALCLARQTVAAKIANCRRTIQRLAAERRMTMRDVPEWLALTACVGRLPAMKSVDAVRGVEGCAANVYFKLLDRFFPPDAPFQGRSRRPPRNPSNALLSFIYVLLAGVFASAIRSHGLDVAGGFFHRGNDRAPALALDLMEPFRPAWADRLALSLLNHHRVKPEEHFERTDEDGYRLTEDGRRIVFPAFDEMMARSIETDVGRIRLRQVVDREVCRFIGMIEGDEEVRFFRAA